MIPSRAFSCSTRSSPSYAKRPLSPSRSDFFFPAIVFLNFDIGIPVSHSPFEIPEQHEGREQLSDAKCAAHPPCVQRFGAVGHPEKADAGRVITGRGPSACARQVRTRRKNSNAEANGPEPWKKRHEGGTQSHEAR